MKHDDALQLIRKRHMNYPFHREHSKHNISVLKTNQNQCRRFSCCQQIQWTNNRAKAICV